MVLNEPPLLLRTCILQLRGRMNFALLLVAVFNIWYYNFNRQHYVIGDSAGGSARGTYDFIDVKSDDGY